MCECALEACLAHEELVRAPGPGELQSDQLAGDAVPRLVHSARPALGERFFGRQDLVIAEHIWSRLFAREAAEALPTRSAGQRAIFTRPTEWATSVVQSDSPSNSSSTSSAGSCKNPKSSRFSASKRCFVRTGSSASSPRSIVPRTSSSKQRW